MPLTIRDKDLIKRLGKIIEVINELAQNKELSSARRRINTQYSEDGESVLMELKHIADCLRHEISTKPFDPEYEAESIGAFIVGPPCNPGQSDHDKATEIRLKYKFRDDFDFKYALGTARLSTAVPDLFAESPTKEQGRFVNTFCKKLDATIKLVSERPKGQMTDDFVHKGAIILDNIAGKDNRKTRYKEDAPIAYLRALVTLYWVGTGKKPTNRCDYDSWGKTSEFGSFVCDVRDLFGMESVKPRTLIEQIRLALKGLDYPTIKRSYDLQLRLKAAYEKGASLSSSV